MFGTVVLENHAYVLWTDCVTQAQQQHRASQGHHLTASHAVSMKEQVK